MSAAGPAAATAPALPPLLTGVEIGPEDDPLAAAARAAAAPEGVPGGSLFYAPRPDRLEAAIALAPETPLEEALFALYAAQVALADAFGALAPPEVAYEHGWPDAIRINGAEAGRFRIAAAAPEAADAPPAWLVIAVSLAAIAPVDGAGADPAAAAAEPGLTPDKTTLAEEGCGDIAPQALLEAWARHFVYWLSRWLDDGPRPVIDAWRGRAVGWGETATLARGPRRARGVVLGLDDRGALMLKPEGGGAPIIAAPGEALSAVPGLACAAGADPAPRLLGRGVGRRGAGDDDAAAETATEDATP